MYKREIEFFLVDIFIAIEKIKRYTKKFDSADAFLESELEWDATIRELSIVGEATNTLLKNSLLDREYRNIVDFRNHITHAYFGIDENIVWEVVSFEIPKFEKELENLVKINNIDITEAIEDAKKDFKYSKYTINFLDNLKIRLMG